MSLAAQLEKASLSPEEINTIIEALKASEYSITETLQKIKDYQELIRLTAKLAGTEEKDIPKINMEFMHAGQPITIEEIKKHLNQLPGIIEKLKLIQSITS